MKYIRLIGTSSYEIFLTSIKLIPTYIARDNHTHSMLTYNLVLLELVNSHGLVHVCVDSVRLRRTCARCHR